MLTSSDSRSSVILVDDHPIVRDGLHQMIERDPGLYVCGEAGSAEEALRMIADQMPDLVTIDVFMDGINGIELTKQLTDLYPDICILIVSMHDEGLYAERALRAGAMGYVMKQAPSQTILAAMHQVLCGTRYVSERLQDILDEVRVQAAEGVAAPADVTARLSHRELSVFRAFGEGLDRNAVAAAFDISIKTVETHRAHIKNKLNISRSADLAEMAKVWLAQAWEHVDDGPV